MGKLGYSKPLVNGSNLIQFQELLLDATPTINNNNGGTLSPFFYSWLEYRINLAEQ
jgi:hypothetical protein